ncbi:glycosyltransferase family 8 protein [Thiotrichales bacterium HSG1]|nr:glycosyltransferase family 8 protein [Thiotrichales bacterium HSG1]
MHNEVNLVLASNEAGAYGLVVTVRSVLEHCSCKCNVYILSSKIPKKIQDQLKESWNTDVTGQIQFIEVNPKIVKNFRVILHLRHKETYLRLFLGDLLPPELERCIYLDIDLLVTDDICQFNQADLQGNWIGAMLDVSAPDPQAQEARHKLLALQHPEKYFNGGVLLVDLTAWREHKITEKSVIYAKDNYDNLSAADQDVLNAILQGKWLQLEQRWNISQYKRELTSSHKGIIHLIGPYKPWHADYDWKFKQLFFEILDKTVFKGWRPVKAFGLASIYWKLYHKTPTLELIRGKFRREIKKLRK